MASLLDLDSPARGAALKEVEQRLGGLLARTRLTLALLGVPGSGLDRHAAACMRARGRRPIALGPGTEAEALEAAFAEAQSTGAGLVLAEPSLWSAPLQSLWAEVLRAGRLDTVIACQTLDPEVEHAAGRLADDLFYALNARTCTIPPVEAWGPDLLAAAEGALEHFEAQLRPGQPPRGLDPASRDRIEGNPGPGDRLGLEGRLLAAAAEGFGPVSLVPTVVASESAPGDSLRAAERQLIQSVLLDCQGNRSRAANRLGVSRSTLYAKLDTHGLR